MHTAGVYVLLSQKFYVLFNHFQLDSPFLHFLELFFPSGVTVTCEYTAQDDQSHGAGFCYQPDASWLISQNW